MYIQPKNAFRRTVLAIFKKTRTNCPSAVNNNLLEDIYTYIERER